jgi:hypothetical protein
MELYLIEARYPGELYDIREFVQPGSAPVILLYNDLVKRVGTNPDVLALAAWRWMIDHVRYPITAEGDPTDWHRMEAYETSSVGIPSPQVTLVAAHEFFEMPGEVLNPNILMADCDGRAVTLASLLRNFLPADRVMVRIGTLADLGGHAWVTVAARDGTDYVMETTLTRFPNRPWVTAQQRAETHHAHFAFNDQVVEGRYTDLVRRVGGVAKISFLEGCYEREGAYC